MYNVFSLLEWEDSEHTRGIKSSDSDDGVLG